MDGRPLDTPPFDAPLETPRDAASGRTPWATDPDRPRLPLRTRVSIALARASRWEFWPAWLFYIPIVVWILLLGLRHRRPTLFTAANPAIDAGGVVGERKHEVLAPLQRHAPDLVAPLALLPADAPEARDAQAVDFARRHGFPVVLKPDVGQRGRGVFIAHDEQALSQYLHRFGGDVIAQRYVAGEEFGIFVARAPGDAEARILSIVHKTFPTVRGDGRRPLGELILANPRARLIAPLLWQRWSDRLDHIPADGTTVQLVEIGAHCRGALFLDARHLATPALIAAMTRLTDAVPGYCFGRVDLRCPGSAELARGEGIRAIELNGVTAESAHIYHPDTPLLSGYAAMFRQWRLAFEIGRANAALGAVTVGPFGLLARFLADRRRSTDWF
ncbi:MAG: hypothetical protein PHP86_07645 [Nevskiales bacterium]|nr:hypothetical protein [Nevskiales bacterium]